MDIDRVQQQRLLSILNQQTLPLASRPLLVPVSYTMDKGDCQAFEQFHSTLIQLGIQIDLMGATTVVVRTIPQLLPQLDIKKFLQSLRTIVPTSASLMQLLVSCQSFDAYQLNHEDKTVLVDYLDQQLLLTSQVVPWCLRLDTEKCRELLDV